jgi:hypothetical protein
MGVRIKKNTPPRKTHKGCIFRISVLAATVMMLAVAGCDEKNTDEKSKEDQKKVAYQQCVGTVHTKAKQDACQKHVWQTTFGESDERWDCSHMGDWFCDNQGK